MSTSLPKGESAEDDLQRYCSGCGAGGSAIALEGCGHPANVCLNRSMIPTPPVKIELQRKPWFAPSAEPLVREPAPTPADQSWADAALAGIVPVGFGEHAKAPDDNPKTVFGLAKPAMSAVPPAALLHLMGAMAEGRRKYGHMNWRASAVSSTIYYDAAMRHLMAWFDGERVAADSGVHHLGHVMACCAIILDAESTAMLNDDRPTPGRFAADCESLTRKDGPISAD